MNISSRAALFFPFFLILYQMVGYLSNDMYLPALPAISSEFSVTHQMIKRTITFWFIGAGILQLISGAISEKFGRRLVMIAGNGVFILGCIVCFYARNIDTMLLARFLQGLGVSSIFVSGYATIHELYERRKAVQIFAIMGSVTILAPAIGPSLGVLILKYWGWRHIFLLLAFFGCITFLLLAVFMPETLKKNYTPFSKLFDGYISILKNQRYIRYTFSFCFLLSASFMWIIESPFIIIKAFGKSESLYAIIQIPVFLSSIIGSQITRYAVIRYEIEKIVKIGLKSVQLLSILFCLFSSLSFTNTAYIICVTALMSSIVCANATLLGPLNRLAIESSDAQTGKKTAFFSTCVSIVAGISTYTISFLKSSSFFPLSCVILLVVQGAALFCYMNLRKLSE